jgi:hypothetical protein
MSSILKPRNPKLFKLTRIPKYHPASSKYKEFWREQKRYCIEGYWEGGFWMPGQLYFYINFGTILLNKKRTSKVKSPGKPFLRDLEWDFFYNWIEARGFSGFEKDPLYTCHRSAEITMYNSLNAYDKDLFKLSNPEAFTEKGHLKKYISAREYLRKLHPCELGKPIYGNQSKDFMMMGSRGFGKSYSVGVGIVLHEWLFDGSTEVILPEEREEDWLPPKSVTVVGAGDGKYSGDLLKKTSYALEKLPGAQMLNGKKYPSPFAKQYTGSWNTNGNIVSKYRKKIGGDWEWAGSFSEIKHRSFKDNPYAANGIRAGAMIFEEIGMFSNLIAARNASVECQMDGSNKYGSMMFLGTGGDMGKGTIDASIMFNDPESFNLLVFKDKWENTGKIGYFVPAYMGLNDYKDKNGFTVEAPAIEYLENHRKKLRMSKSGSAAIDDELQNRPLVPSEAFLTKRGNIFPVDALRNRLINLKSDDNYTFIEKPVTLYFDKNTNSGVNYKLDLKKELIPLNNFPLTEQQSRNRDGCVVIYEFPMEVGGEIPNDMYIIGHDPYASDNSTGGSLGGVYVLKNKKYIKYGHDEIVASYVGRPYDGRKVLNENIYKLSLFYGGAKIYFENVRGNVKEYFEKIKKLNLLAKQPTTVLNNKKASHQSVTKTIIYGYPMSNQKMKAEGIQYLRDWLIEERGIDENEKLIRNLDLIPDMALLQELIAFNYEGNFDRVMAFLGCIIGLEETHNQYINKAKESRKKNSLEFLLNRKFINNQQSNWTL